jgi:type I restriction enzyme S subunit
MNKTTLPQEWNWVTIGDVITDLKSGLSRKLSVNDIGLPVLRSNNLTEQGVDFSDIKYWYVKDPQRANTANYFLRDGDILVNFINSVSQIGKCSLYENKLKRDVIYTTNIMRLRTNDRTTPQFFLLLTKTSEYNRYVQAITKPAVNQASFTTKDYKKYSFPLPPLDEQRRIAKILGEWDKAITLTERLIKAKQRRRKALMQQLLTGKRRFGEFAGDDVKPQRTLEGTNFYNPYRRVELPKSWSMERLSDVTSLITCGVAARPEYVDKNGTPFLSSQNVKEGKIVWERYKHISKEKHFELTKNNKPERGDILYTRVGSFGDAAIIDRDIEFSIFVSLTLIKPIQSIVDNRYLSYQLNSHAYRQLAVSTTTGLGVQNLNVGEVRKFLIPIPSLPEQRRIAAVLQACDAEIELLGRKLSALRRQKQGLMQKLLTGRVRV